MFSGSRVSSFVLIYKIFRFFKYPIEWGRVVILFSLRSRCCRFVSPPMVSGSRVRLFFLRLSSWRFLRFSMVFGNFVILL